MTAEEKKVYTKIKKQTAKEVLSPEFISNKSGSLWIADYGICYTMIAMEPCNLGGVFVDLSFSFFWGIKEESITFDWGFSDSTRITSPKVPNISEALLYKNEWVYSGPHGDPIREDTVIYSSPEDFEKHLKILLKDAKEIGIALNWNGDYRRLQKMLLRIRNKTHNRCFTPDYKTIDIAIVSILGGDIHTGKKLLKEVIKKKDEYDSPRALILLEKSSDIKEFREFIRQKVIAGREIRQKRFPKLKVDAIPSCYLEGKFK